MSIGHTAHLKGQQIAATPAGVVLVQTSVNILLGLENTEGVHGGL